MKNWQEHLGYNVPVWLGQKYYISNVVVAFNNVIEKCQKISSANWYAEYIMKNAGLEEAQARMEIAGRNISNLRYADILPLWQKVKN